MDELLRESQENAPVSFLVGGGGFDAADVLAELAAGAWAEDDAAPGLRAGDPAGGDQGMLGSAFVMLLSDSVLAGWALLSRGLVCPILAMLASSQ